MGAAIIAAIAAVVGIIVGGGLRAREAAEARKIEAAGLLSAICAEVEAVNRLANHRQFLTGFQDLRAVNASLVSSGQGAGPNHWMVLDLSHNYFATYEALLPKLGLLHPYFADRITRFYTYAKAVTENYRSDSAWQKGMTAELAVAALDNDIALLHTMHGLGELIATFRSIAPPDGIRDPFLESEGQTGGSAVENEIGQAVLTSRPEGG